MMPTIPSLRLIYFPRRGRAECSRMILAYGAIPYTEEDCTSYFGCNWLQAKQSEKLPFGQLPILEVASGTIIAQSGEVGGGVIIAQSGAINRYLASLVADNFRPGFVPTDPTERALCDMVHEVAQDLAEVDRIVNWYVGDRFQTQKEHFFEKVLPARLAALSKLLGNKNFFCGDLVTYSDFAVYHRLDLTRLVEPSVIKEYPNVVDWMAKVEALEGVREYLEGRPEPVDIGVKPRLQKKQ